MSLKFMIISSFKDPLNNMFFLSIHVYLVTTYITIQTLQQSDSILVPNLLLQLTRIKK